MKKKNNRHAIYYVDLNDKERKQLILIMSYANNRTLSHVARLLFCLNEIKDEGNISLQEISWDFKIPLQVIYKILIDYHQEGFNDYINRLKMESLYASYFQPFTICSKFW